MRAGLLALACLGLGVASHAQDWRSTPCGRAPAGVGAWAHDHTAAAISALLEEKLPEERVPQASWRVLVEVTPGWPESQTHHSIRLERHGAQVRVEVRAPTGPITQQLCWLRTEHPDWPADRVVAAVRGRTWRLDERDVPALRTLAAELEDLRLPALPRGGLTFHATWFHVRIESPGEAAVEVRARAFDSELGAWAERLSEAVAGATILEGARQALLSPGADADSRVWALTMVDEFSGAWGALLEPLAARLDDPEQPVRVAAAGALAAVPDPVDAEPTLAVLRLALAKADAEVRVAAAGAAANLGPRARSLHDELVALAAKDPDPDVRKVAGWAAGRTTGAPVPEED